MGPDARHLILDAAGRGRSGVSGARHRVLDPAAAGGRGLGRAAED